MNVNTEDYKMQTTNYTRQESQIELLETIWKSLSSPGLRFFR